MILRAPAKLNLCLYLGPRREDGLHELVSVFCPLTLADRIVVEEAEADEVVCAGLEGPNLAEAALGALRSHGWARPPLRIEIEKRIPVAAGLGGGSADAGAVLRLARGEVAGLDEIAAALGADVPSQLDPGPALVRGAGERVERLPALAEASIVGIPFEEGLATGSVYAEADRHRLARSEPELDEVAAAIADAVGSGGFPLPRRELLINDLQPAALALRPEIDEALAALREVGATAALLAGSGPTAVGLFDDAAAADGAANALPPRFAQAFVAALETGT